MKENTSTPTPEGASPTESEKGEPGVGAAGSALRERATRDRLLIESWAQAVWETNAEGVVVKDSPSWRAYTGQTLEEWLGYSWLDAIHPDDREYAERQWREAMAAKSLVNAELRMRAPDGSWRWTNVRAAPVLDERGDIEKWAGMNIDIDARKRAEAALRESDDRQAFLLKLSDALRPLSDGLEIEEVAARLTAQQFETDHAHFTPVEIIDGVEYYLVRRAYSAPGRTSVNGLYPLSDFPAVTEVLRSGQTMAVDEVMTDARLREEDKAAYAVAQVASFLQTPLIRNGALIATFAVHGSTPRKWSKADVALLSDTTDRTWAAIERARSVAAVEQSEDRQAFLLKLSDAMRPLVTAEDIERVAVEALGQKLAASRVFYATIDPGGDTWSMEYDYSHGGPGGPGHFPMSDYQRRRLPGWQAGIVSHVADSETDPDLSDDDRASYAAFGARAAVGIPLVKGGRFAALLVINQTTPRQWTEAEIELAREAAERTWAEIERARAVAALRESEERYRSLFESMDEAYAVVDVLKNEAGEWTDFRFIEVNPAFLEHTNMPPPVGKTATELLGTPNPRWAKLYGQALNTGKPLRVEEPEPTLCLTFDLNIFTLDRDLNRVAVLFTNISERKQSEQALRESERHANILLAELQHRVRNTLGVVRSIARRTGENSSSVEEMQAHFQGRLDAFSRVQAAMTRSAAGTVDLASLIEDEMVAHAAREGEQVSIEGPDIELEPKTAERLSLAIHELTTNAVKHGAFVNATGKVRIHWSQELSEAGPVLQLSWSESGVTIEPSETRRTGFGMELLQRSLPYDLQASTSVEFRPTGLHFELRMPLEPARTYN